MKKKYCLKYSKIISKSNSGICAMHGINSCLWINQPNNVAATAALQTFKFYKMKTLTRDEMKKVMGGNAPVDCNDDCNVNGEGCGAGYYCDDLGCGMIVKKGCIKKA